ncbi:DUF2785 domain-containing protein [Saccharibacillus alkalitolerans]|uniref:DUF2785 domain-containing protein n=1 Tax=Saccharibacillus alkalitolerans TaxID=2705290 RepID=A0ABX0F7Z9_9BACL|nr:DUF2785 domain-containing protein [Saccharibacillus alkalitolerans]NGZ75629.1 DUF2785 domain-containing protein [Saccharibacillus alkalitolerans]
MNANERKAVSAYDFTVDSALTPAVGMLYAMIEYNLRRLERLAGGMSAEQLDFLPDGGSNSAAQLLRHLAVTELYWVYRLQSLPYPPEALAEFGPMYDESGRLPAVSGRSAAELLGECRAVHERLHRVCLGLSDEDLQRQVPYEKGASATVRWGIWHVGDHCRHHYAQIAALKKAAKEAGIAGMPVRADAAERDNLQAALREIRRSGRLPEPERLGELAAAMLEHIGDPDPELRDELIYGSFSDWIGAGVFKAEQLRSLMNTALDERHVGYGIGENGTDTVFVRSFSMLLLPLILSADREQAFLTEKEWRIMFRTVLRALDEERDLRGYESQGGRGWAHAAAHAADALEDLGRSKLAGPSERLEMLEAVRRRLLTADRVFVHDEDDRLAAAAETVLTCGNVEEQDFADWLERFGEAPGPEAKPFAGEGRVNARLFLQRLHVRLLEHRSQAGRAESIRIRASRLLMG